MNIPRTAARWERMPQGWTEESRAKMWHTLVGDSEHKVSECIRKMQDKDGVDDPGAFCAALADRVEGPEWRKRKRKAALDDLEDLAREIGYLEREHAALERDLLLGEDEALERQVQKLEARLKDLRRELRELQQHKQGASLAGGMGRVGSQYIQARLLPMAFSQKLKNLGLAVPRRFEVRISSEFEIAVGAGDGSRGACLIYNLKTGAADSYLGAWGGGALGVREQSPVDDFSRGWALLLDDIIVAKGSMGAEKYVFLMMTQNTLDWLLEGDARGRTANLREMAARRLED